MIERNLGNGTVLGIAAVASGVVGTVAAALMSRGAEEESREGLDFRRQRDVLTRAGAEQKRNFMKKAKKRAPRDIDMARQRVSELGSQVTGLAASGIGTAKSRLDARDLQDASQRLAVSLKERSKQGASLAESAGNDVAAKASDLLSEARNQVPGLKDRAGKAVSDAQGRGSHLGGQVRERLPDVKEQVESRVTPIVKDVRKQVKPILDEAATVATTAFGVAGTKAHDARKWAEKDALPDVQESLGNVGHLISNVSSEATERLVEVGGTVEERSREVATVAAKGTRDTGSLLFWSTVAAGVVYYAFLSKEQREQVNAAGRRVGSEAREIYRDIQGYDEEFS